MKRKTVYATSILNFDYQVEFSAEANGFRLLSFEVVKRKLSSQRAAIPLTDVGVGSGNKFRSSQPSFSRISLWFDAVAELTNAKRCNFSLEA